MNALLLCLILAFFVAVQAVSHKSRLSLDSVSQMIKAGVPREERIKKLAKVQLEAMQHAAEDAVSNNPKIAEDRKRIAADQTRVSEDMIRSKNLSKVVQSRLATGREDLHAQEKNAEQSTKRMADFTAERMRKLENYEKELMSLQRGLVKSSFAEMDKSMASVDSKRSSLLESTSSATASAKKGDEMVQTAEKRLSELKGSIDERVKKLTTLLHQPGHMFPGQRRLDQTD